MTNKSYQNLHISFDQSDYDAVLSSFNSVSFSGKSPIIADYERVISDYFGTQKALACSNGTVAIELAIRGLGLQPGDAVALPPTAPIMTILPVITTGCVPVFCDVSPLSFSPDLAHLKSLIARKSIKAIIVVPMWGYPLEMKAVVEFCHSQGIKVIEDCAHAFGTRSDNAFLGTLGDVSCFSTHERKLVSTGEGGFCLTNDENVYDRMLSWQHHGLKASSRISGYLLGEDIGTNAKLSPMCAALGINQFLKLDKKIADRRTCAEKVRHALSAVAEIKEFPRYQNEEINGYSLVYYHLNGSSVQQGLEMLNQGVMSDTTRYKYKALYREPAFTDYEENCPNAEHIIDTIFTVPCHEGLTDADIDYIASVVSSNFSR
ncbi:DegT/DnrJ/EryC1/StrS family aminotransferase [Pantoea ananatis]|uniref:DegT/DnrJ/EryC1/StrS family aminotransferase n=2 Tax=Pantoea ananas TaxID=553 RepID=UPI000CF544CD|nr:DegT/DnrJ/EryC1/StrS family aminotransferase [Pantoea ananatis]PQK94988.1 DegT/DnrJ/EryC1/StrS aminotransferase [Pantoea ananatis]PXV97052.1 dTDP-4-amino-4,6-dideoxygalactose transaminase [Pantoea ananatis]